MDGVDNWSWYGESRRDCKEEWYPGDWNELSEDEQFDLSFWDIAGMCIDAGEYPQLMDVEECLLNE